MTKVAPQSSGERFLFSVMVLCQLDIICPYNHSPKLRPYTKFPVSLQVKGKTKFLDDNIEKYPYDLEIKKSNQMGHKKH